LEGDDVTQNGEGKAASKRFRGRSDHALDEKGRLNIPARFQEVLRELDDDRLMVIPWNKCIKAYPVPEWENLEQTLVAEMKNHPENKKMVKHMIGGVVECQLKQGRILLPPKMRDDCGIEKDVVLEGMMNIFEIWDKHTWELENKPSGEDFQKFEETLSQFGLF